MVLGGAARGPGQEFFLRELFADHLMNGATKALNGPVVTVAIA
ncbi:hypothetical protein N184_27265 [Sinorhizobium sp. GL28]|nr:hypothetical protein N184_27265 [Sinorhizobium sp. GL28]